MLIAARIRRIRERHDDGITLMELVVAMSLTTIISAMALTFFVGMNDANDTTVNANLDTASARNVLQDWTQLLSLADSPTTPGTATGRIVQVTPTDIEFFADVNNRESTCLTTNPETGMCPATPIQLSIESGSLLEQRYAPTTDGSWPTTAPVSTSYLASNASTTGWLFTPYVAGNPPAATLPALCNGGIAAGICDDTPAGTAVLASIVRIDITFTVASGNGKHPQTFTSSAAINGSSA